MLTARQQRLTDLIEHRVRRYIPTGQRDLAKIMGIRPHSLKKLLRRTRERLAQEGRALPALPRMPKRRANWTSLSGMNV